MGRRNDSYAKLTSVEIKNPVQQSRLAGPRLSRHDGEHCAVVESIFQETQSLLMPRAQKEELRVRQQRERFYAELIKRLVHKVPTLSVSRPPHSTVSGWTG
jgi:hypothetical protein